MAGRVLMDEMTSPEVGEAIKAGKRTVIVVYAATEGHGPALPLIVDVVHGTAAAVRAAEILGDALVGPTVTMGWSQDNRNFPGTIMLSQATLLAITRDYLASLRRHGFEKVYLYPAHGANTLPLRDNLTALRAEFPELQIAMLEDLPGFVQVWDTVAKSHGLSPQEAGSHAGDAETSILLYTRPDLVRMERAERGWIGNIGDVLDQIFNQGIDTIAPNGVMGDPRTATAEHGRDYVEAFGRFLAEDIRRQLG